MKFTHLHVHSHYSLLDGLAKIDQILDACQKLKMPSIALTDHGSTYGLVEFFIKAKKRGVKPILGVEAYLTPDSRHEKRPNIDTKRFHLILLVKDKTGYQNLVKLVTKSYLEGFYYKPRIDKEILRKHSQGLIGASACLAGEIPRAITNGKPDQAEKLALEYQEIFGPGNFYLEIQHHPGIPEQAQANQEIIKIAKKHKIPLIATNDCHYVNSEDRHAQDVLMSIQTDKKVDDQERLTMKVDDFSIRSQEQMIKDFKDIPEAIDNTQKIVDQCNFEFKLGEYQLPHFEVPNNLSDEEYLKNLCNQGIKERYEDKPKNKEEIQKRLKYELKVIQTTGFASYFLIVQDFVNWAKSQGIGTGPGRGSAAGSIVAYLIGITEIDPLKYDLLFERFLNPERISMPDIDLDFADDQRDEVIKYVAHKYGNDHVAQIITFGTMAARAAVRDVGRAMDYAYTFCDQTAKMIPFGMSLEEAINDSPELHQAYETDENTKTLLDMAKKMEGVARHASTHAAAVVITKDPLDKLVPTQHPTQNDEAIVTQYEMHAIEDLGLLKMDFLGLRTLTVMQNTVNLIAKNHNQYINFNNLPLNDKEAFKLLRAGNTTGVFQLESQGMKKNLKQLKPTVFEDIIAMVALYRPGPMEFIPEFIARKHGEQKVEYLHPKLEPILKDTYGICIFQEQLMQIARDLAGFSLAEADVLRKAVGKKIKKLLDEQKEKMINGMVKNEIEKRLAKKIWQTIEPFAQYGFNKAHSACYGMIGYQTAYLKAHYPTEFMAATMASEQNDIDRIAFLVSETRKMDIQVLAPDINESDKDFAPSKNMVIRFGLNAIKNVGHNVVSAIVNERKKNGKYANISDFIERVHSKDLNKKSLESLIKCGAMDQFGGRNQLLTAMDQILNLARETQKAKNNGQFSLFADQPNSSVDFKLPQVPPAEKKECLAWEKELLGLYVSEHPLKYYKEKFEKETLFIKNISHNHVGRRLRLGGIVNKIQKITTKRGELMLFVELEDLTGKTEVLVFPNVLEKNATAWQEDKIIMVNGRLSDRFGSLKILCDSVKVVE